jgi:bifunctional non-homologous end joining protein LigD
LELDGAEVRVSNPDKVFFPELGLTKMDLVAYYLAVADDALVGARERPTTLYRWPNGVAAPQDALFQKRAPKPHP